MEQRPLNFTLASNTTTTIQVVAPALTAGMRKVKNITVNLVPSLLSGDATTEIFWALVYVPEGTQPGVLNTTASAVSLYEPNQFVMNCGICDPNAGPIRFFTPLARNLNSGDSIYLLVTTHSSFTDPPHIIGTVRFAISY